MKKAYLVLLFLINISCLYSISLVYSLKIRRVFQAADKLSDKKSLAIVTALPIIYKRDRHIIDNSLALNIYDKRLVGGSLFNIRALSSSHAWWAEITVGIENETARVSGSSSFNVSRTGFDDIVFAAGHNFFLNDKMQLVLYGIGGVPTYFKVSPLESQDTLVGTRFFSVGAGGEISYAFIRSLKHAFIGVCQSRIIHFFNRNWYPAAPQGSTICPGNITDVLIALQYRYKRSILEAGFNPTLFTNQALVLPTSTIKSSLYVRNSCYATLSHALKKSVEQKKPWILGLGVSVGCGTKFDTKIVSCWANITKLF